MLGRQCERQKAKESKPRNNRQIEKHRGWGSLGPLVAQDQVAGSRREVLLIDEGNG